MTEALLIGAVAGAFVALVFLAFRLATRRRMEDRPAPRARPGVSRVTLDVRADLEDPGPARRLAAAAAAPLFEADPLISTVEVQDRDGALLAVIDRADGLELSERDPFESAAPTEQLALPPAVRDRLPDDPSLTEIVRAILEVAGHDVEVDGDGDVLRVGDRAVVVLDATHPDALSAAFLRYRDSGARSGVVVARRSVAPSEIHRREMLAPDLRYADAGALQRMADAVAIGADPITFALGPPS